MSAVHQGTRLPAPAPTDPPARAHARAGAHAHPQPQARDALHEVAYDVVHVVDEAAHTVATEMHHVVDAVKPRLRGWLHAGTCPVAFVAGFALVVAADDLRTRIGMAVFAATAWLLFGTSAVYHRGTWSPGLMRVLKRLDHANIFIVIAGTSTAFAASLLPPEHASTFLTVMWVGALAGTVFKVVNPDAPRWLSTPLYVLLGWIGAFYAQPMYAAGGPLVVALILLGGLLYTLGAVVYGVRRPDPSPRWFGFHEVFHVLTVLGYFAHLAAAALIVAAGNAVAA